MKYLFLIIFIQSCSLLGPRDEQPFSSYKLADNPTYQKNDYLDHFSFLAKEYMNSPGITLVKLNSPTKKYFRQRYNEVVKSNELLLNQKDVEPKFFVVQERAPFYFSLPGGYFFFSLGLMKKYLKNEQILMAVLTYEMVKMHRGIYNKNIIIPIGYLRTEKLLSLTRLNLDHKIEVSKWTYFAMKRAGFDPSAHLAWLQIQNRNILDFTMQRGDSRSISREEFIFKNFIAEQGLSDKDSIYIESNSSKKFYQMLNFMKRINI